MFEIYLMLTQNRNCLQLKSTLFSQFFPSKSDSMSIFSDVTDWLSGKYTFLCQCPLIGFHRFSKKNLFKRLITQVLHFKTSSLSSSTTLSFQLVNIATASCSLRISHKTSFLNASMDKYLQNAFSQSMCMYIAGCIGTFYDITRGILP